MAAPSSSKATRSRSAPSCAKPIRVRAGSCNIVPSGTKVPWRNLAGAARWGFAACAALLAAACLLDPKSDDLPSGIDMSPTPDVTNTGGTPTANPTSTGVPTPTNSPDPTPTIPSPSDSGEAPPADAGDAGSEEAADAGL
jgi:hypothetical protein